MAIEPGPQRPEKYPYVGPRYRKWGEQLPNFYYEPSIDNYKENPEAKKKRLQDEGVVPKDKKPQGLGAGLAAAGGTALVVKGAEKAAEKYAPVIWDGVKSIFTQGGKKVAAPVLNEVSRIGASQAGSSAGIQAAGSGGLGGLAQTGLGALGVGAGAYGAIQGIANQDPVTAGLGGAGIGFGLNTLGVGLGPIGWAAAVAVPALGALLGKLGDKDRFKEEGNRLRKLRDKGVYVPDALLAAPLTKGRSKKELVEIARATGGNEKFAQSRKESDLTGRDIIGFSTFAERDPDWFKKPVEEQIAYAQSLLDKGLIRERKGQIEILAEPLKTSPTTQAVQDVAAQAPQEAQSATSTPKPAPTPPPAASAPANNGPSQLPAGTLKSAAPAGLLAGSDESTFVPPPVTGDALAPLYNNTLLPQTNIAVPQTQGFPGAFGQTLTLQPNGLLGIAAPANNGIQPLGVPNFFQQQNKPLGLLRY